MTPWQMPPRCSRLRPMETHTYVEFKQVSQPPSGTCRRLLELHSSELPVCSWPTLKNASTLPGHTCMMPKNASQRPACSCSIPQRVPYLPARLSVTTSSLLVLQPRLRPMACSRLLKPKPPRHAISPPGRRPSRLHRPRPVSAILPSSSKTRALQLVIARQLAPNSFVSAAAYRKAFVTLQHHSSS